MRLATALLAACLTLAAAAPGASATHEVLDGAGVLLQAAQDGALVVAGAGVAAAERMAAVAVGAAGPAEPAARGLVAAVSGGLGSAGGLARDAFLAVGDGHGSVNGMACPGLQAAVERHQPLSNDPEMVINLMGSVGDAPLSCSVGWRAAFGPTEVWGNEEDGFEAYSWSIDATIWATVGPLREDGTRSLYVLQITGYFDDVFEFEGNVAQLL